jgi:hypothetical protein
VPPPQRTNPLWGVASLLLHGVLAAVLLVVTRHPPAPGERTVVISLLPPGTPGPREVAMPALGLGRGGGGGVPDEAGGPAARAAPGPDVDSVIPPAADDVQVLIGAERGTGDRTAVPGVIGPRRLVRPDYGDGRLWVRSFEAALGVVGPSQTVELHVARVDSAVKERLQAFIENMPPDSFAIAPPMDWTIDVGESTWGVDGSWIYLGDIKIPSIILALLPLPQGNIDLAQRETELLRIRQDILYAANRAETSEEFRDYIEQTRQRKQAERDAARAAQGDTAAGTPTPIP